MSDKTYAIVRDLSEELSIFSLPQIDNEFWTKYIFEVVYQCNDEFIVNGEHFNLIIRHPDLFKGAGIYVMSAEFDLILPQTYK